METGPSHLNPIPHTMTFQQYNKLGLTDQKSSSLGPTPLAEALLSSQTCEFDQPKKCPFSFDRNFPIVKRFLSIFGTILDVPSNFEHWLFVETIVVLTATPNSV